MSPSATQPTASHEGSSNRWKATSRSGLELCRHIKRMAPETVVIIVSASTDPSVAMEALHKGASAFVNKTAAVDDLVPAILRAMAMR